MMERIRPFMLLLKKDRLFPRWAVLRTLLRLAVLRRLHRTQGSVRIRFMGNTLYGPDYATMSVLIKEKFVDEEYRFEATSPSPVIIDGGSNIGISVVYFKWLYPDAEIHCFEPASDTFGWLERNVRENGIKHVFLHRSALSREDGIEKLFIPATRGHINASLILSAGDGDAQVVPVVRLSGFLKSFDVVDLVKLDVEGSEYDVVKELNDSNVLRSGKIRRFIIEYHHLVAGRMEALVRMMETCGYKTKQHKLFAGREVSDYIITAWRTE